MTFNALAALLLRLVIGVARKSPTVCGLFGRAESKDARRATPTAENNDEGARAVGLTSLDSDEAHALPLSMAGSTQATPSAPNEMDIWGG